MAHSQTLSLVGASPLIFRFCSIVDIVAVHRFYFSLSDNTRHFFHPTFFQKARNFVWLRDEALLLLSAIAGVRKILVRINPIMVYFPLVALDSKQEIVAFMFFKIRRRLNRSGFEAEHGIVVRDDYQCKGLGYQLLILGNEFAKTNGIQRLYSLVHAENSRMIHLYQRFGFKKVSLVRRKNRDAGTNYQAYEMICQLREVKGNRR